MLRPVRTLAELQDALHTATPGDTLELAPGEYRGPVVIDKSITLRGLDRQTVLWRRGGPVVFVRVPGVKLERLLVERTVDAHGPTIVHYPECVPTGKESMELDGDTLINLGELVPGHTLSVPLEIGVKTRTEISVTGLHGAWITPTVLESPGNHQVNLTLDGNALINKGELLLGEVTIREGAATRYLWVSGIVLDTLPPEQPLCLAVGQMRLYPSVNGLILDGGLLSVLEGGAELAGMGRYAILQRDMGTLALYVPGEPPSPVLLNGFPVIRGTRRVLRENDTIKIGEIALIAMAAEPLPITIEPTALTFADFDAQFPDPLTLTVKNGKAGWRGEVKATLPWLGVSPDGQVRIPPSRHHEWSIFLNQDALTLADNTYEAQGGVLVIGPNHILSVDVKMAIKRPDVALQIQPVDMETVEWGWPVERTVEFAIVNAGRGGWSGRVDSNLPWLEVITPMPVSDGPWSQTVIEVKFVPTWDKLKVGVHEIAQALTLKESSGTYPISARIEVLPAQGHLTVLTPLIAFDAVERGMPALPDARLEVRNEGGGTWTGQVRAATGWVQVEPADLTLGPGASAELTVTLLDIPPDQPLDAPLVIDDIQFGEDTAVQVRLTVVELPPYLSVRPVNFAPFVKGETPPEGTLNIYNMGPSIWRGTVKSTLTWLTVPDRPFLCEPGEIIDLTVTLSNRAALKIGVNRFEGALVLTGTREPVTASVQVDLRDAALELYLETPTLNFGQVNGANTELPTDTIRLLNANATPWKGRIELCVPWLTLEGKSRAFDVEIPKMSAAEFKVLLGDAVRWMKPGLLVEEKAILITSEQDKQTLIARVMFILNEWTPLLEITPAKVALTAGVTQKISVRNQGDRSWPLTVSAAPWLNATPAEFTLEPGKSRDIEIKARPENAVPGTLNDPRGVVIVGPGQEHEIAVELKIDAPKPPEPKVEVKAEPPKDQPPDVIKPPTVEL